MFTAIRTNNPDLISELRRVHVAAVEDNYYAKNYIVPLEEAHVTLNVFELLDMRQEPFLIEEPKVTRPKEIPTFKARQKAGILRIGLLW